MGSDRTSFKVLILTMDSEMIIGSVVLFLKYYLEKRIGVKPMITVIDNGSRDRTRKVAVTAGAEVLKVRERVPWTEVVKKALAVGQGKRFTDTGHT